MNADESFNPHIHHRHTIRLAGYDYSRAGAYFLTLCAHHHKNIFGTIVDDRIELNACGRIVYDEWLKSVEIRREIELDEFIIMPDHLHGIVIIHDIDRRGDRPVAPTLPVIPTLPVTPTLPVIPTLPVTPTLPVIPALPVAPTNPDVVENPMGPKPKSIASFVAGFKSATTKRIYEIRHTPGTPAWQRNYYERIIRNEFELYRIREYIKRNPVARNNTEIMKSTCGMERNKPGESATHRS